MYKVSKHTKHVNGVRNRISRIGISSISYKKSNTWVYNEEVEVKEGSVKRIILSDWQNECKKGFIKELIKGDKIGGIINASTGAGKTITILSLLTEELKHNKNTKVIVAVPQRDISLGFCKKYIIDGEEIEVSNKGIKDDKKTESILNFLKFPSNHPGKRTLICTHQALIAAFKRASHNRKYFKNVLIVIDEAHHIDGSETSNELG
ncbi:MAG: DEAD/DEAH box helicase family protein, partial [Methanothrix sp.]|nr:DEAD/DEAH box helicase family protein [Methanothrix sp.]